MSTVLYPGSFDPFHLGHLDVVEQASALFGDVVVAVMHNPDKPSGVLSTDQRVSLIAASCSHLPHVTVRSFPGLAVDAALSVKALCIVKGLRTSGDFEVEQQMAHTNSLSQVCARYTYHASRVLVLSVVALFATSQLMVAMFRQWCPQQFQMPLHLFFPHGVNNEF